MEQQLCKVAAALVTGNDELIRVVFQNALENGITPSMLREVILTSYLFDGYPTALEGFRILGEIAGTPEDCQSEFIYHPENIALWRDRGEPPSLPLDSKTIDIK